MRTDIVKPLLLLTIACLGPASGCEGRVTDPPRPMTDLSVRIEGPAMLDVGETATYVITVTNHGPEFANTVVLTDSVSAEGAVTSASDGGTIAGRRVTWQLPDIPASSSVEVMVQATLEAAGQLIQRVRVTSSTSDPVATNNDGTWAPGNIMTTFGTLADVQAGQTGPASAVPGSPVTYRVIARNAGPSVALDVMIVDTIPAGFVPESVTGDGELDGMVVRWPVIDSLVAGDSVVYDVSGTMPSIGPIRFAASVTTASEETNGDNNGGSGARVRTLTSFESIAVIEGQINGEHFGFLTENLGDLDGDGANDFIVTAPFSPVGTNSGRAFVFSGRTATQLYGLTGDAGTTFRQFGQGADRIGDIDGDGVADFVVGAQTYVVNQSGAPGSAYVFSGKTGARLQRIDGAGGSQRYGISVAGTGDINGDGTPDFAVGAPGTVVNGQPVGRVFVYSGTDFSQILAVDGTEPESYFGLGIAGPGDLTGDGVPDIVVGAHASSGGGRIHVFSGADGSRLYTIGGLPGAGGQLGRFWLEGAGDVDGDGVPDIYATDFGNTAAGSNSISGGAGRAYIFSGVDGSVIHAFTGENPGDNFGIGRGGRVDADGDGVLDVVVAAWVNSDAGQFSGKAYLYSGKSGQLLRTFNSLQAGEALGYDAVGLGDVDGDGAADFVISGGISPTSPTTGGAGRVYLVRGVKLP